MVPVIKIWNENAADSRLFFCRKISRKKISFPTARARMADGADAVAAGMEKVVLGEDGQVRYL